MKKLHLLLILILVFCVAAIGFARPHSVEKESLKSKTTQTLAPNPTTIDQITHNVSNIVTTIDNFGYIGGYSYYGLPSGEWPRNSGHSYIAEIRYWMGAVTAANDTLVANTYDDFEAIPMPVNGVDDTKIYLSTDSERFYNYDLADTTGLSDGKPAYGWRVWDNNFQSWDYNQNFNSISAQFNPSGPTSLQDSHYRFHDEAMGAPLLGLEMNHTAYQWNYSYNEDFMYVILDITNNSTEDYSEFAFGLYIDIDVGGDDGAGGNGNVEDAVVYDMAEGWAYTYDVQNYDPGWDAKTGLMGTKILATPGNVGLTAFRTDDWSVLPNDDAGRFAMINSTQFDAPLPPTDQFYIQTVRGINLTAGETVRLVYAIVAGDDSVDFVNNVNLAQNLYDNYYIGPEPPTTPTLSARPSDSKVFLSWGDTSEVSIDPLSGLQDFKGYKLYRSDNQGKSWDDTLKTYTIINPGDPIPHTFVDTGLYNGVDYWYCLSAYDGGDPAIGIGVLQSGFGIAGQTPNVVSVRPRSNPAGFYESSETVDHLYSGPAEASDGEVVPIIFDETQLTAETYAVVFEESPFDLKWHLLNDATGDTVLSSQTIFNNHAADGELADGMVVLVANNENVPKSFGQTSSGGGTVSISSVDGSSLVYWTGVPSYAFAPAQYRAAYELRYTTDLTEAVSMWEGFDGVAYPLTLVPFEAWNLLTNQRVSIALDKWPIDGTWTVDDAIIIVDAPYDPLTSLTATAFPYYFGWRVNLDNTNYAPVFGDIVTIEGNGANGPDDKFVFKTFGVDAASASTELAEVRVVPNPYFVNYSSMVETNEGQAVIEFQNIPDECSIRIYNLAGDLVQTIIHNSGDGVERWDINSNNRQQVASGTYFYHIDSEYGEHLGRFAIIK